jgi:phage-related minor tail protein
MGGGFLPIQVSRVNRAAFDRGNVIPFARGGIIDRPTLFPVARGTGLMGEARPEGILPLRRHPSGRLGVEVAGGKSGGNHTVNQSIVINGKMDGETIDRFRRTASQAAAEAAIALEDKKRRFS